MERTTVPTIAEIEAMTTEDIKAITSIKCLKAVFENGKSGRKVEMSEIKDFPKDERDALAEECRNVFLAAAMA
jgi:hypothetical protein